jgi:CheY-like chemotaxis protein
MTHPALLIADDEEAICYALAREVRRRGVTPLVAADGCRAVGLAGATGPELVAVILDIRMPRLDGVSAALAIRRLRPAVPLALMTAFGECELPPALVDTAVRVFRKPFGLETFSDWVADVLRPSLRAAGEGLVGCGLLPRRAGAA